MDLRKIIQQQILLDEAIKKAHFLEQDYQEEMFIALFTEVGEFANEVQSFKYWKKSKKIDQNNLLEEYADGLHFLMSFAIKYNCNSLIEPLVLSKDINKQFLEIFNAINKMAKKISKRKIEKAIAIYLGLAKLLDISDDKINDAYKLKNQKNFERIKNNY